MPTDNKFLAQTLNGNLMQIIIKKKNKQRVDFCVLAELHSCARLMWVMLHIYIGCGANSRDYFLLFCFIFGGCSSSVICHVYSWHDTLPQVQIDARGRNVVSSWRTLFPGHSCGWRQISAKSADRHYADLWPPFARDLRGRVLPLLWQWQPVSGMAVDAHGCFFFFHIINYYYCLRLQAFELYSPR